MNFLELISIVMEAFLLYNFSEIIKLSDKKGKIWFPFTYGKDTNIYWQMICVSQYGKGFALM